MGIRGRKSQQGDHHDEEKLREGGQPDKSGLRDLLATNGREHLLPLVKVFAVAGGALAQIIDVIGRAAIEAVLGRSELPMWPGSRRLPGGREGLSKNHGLPGPLDAKGTPRRALHSPGRATGGRRVA